MEKIAEDGRIEISKEIYNLIMYGEIPEYPDMPVGKIVISLATVKSNLLK